jgi:hypothetical protein
MTYKEKHNLRYDTFNIWFRCHYHSVSIFALRDTRIFLCSVLKTLLLFSLLTLYTINLYQVSYILLRVNDQPFI